VTPSSAGISVLQKRLQSLNRRYLLMCLSASVLPADSDANELSVQPRGAQEQLF